MREHIVSLNPQDISEFSENAFKFILIHCINDGCKHELVNFSIEYFGCSNSYSQTQKRFDIVIFPFLVDLSLDQINRLLLLSNCNDQIHHRIGMKQRLRSMTENFDGVIDRLLYPKIFPTSSEL